MRRGRLCPHGQAEQPADEEAARLRPRNYGFSKLSKLIKSMGRFDWKTEGADNSEYFVRDTQRADK
ncbi:MAG: OST-HTH/LOTUS domain-containing protein [Lawsonibacter sp.]